MTSNTKVSISFQITIAAMVLRSKVKVVSKKAVVAKKISHWRGKVEDISVYYFLRINLSDGVNFFTAARRNLGWMTVM
jgi:hypothetical protein